jgi:hypothetical protein
VALPEEAFRPVGAMQHAHFPDQVVSGASGTMHGVLLSDLVRTSEAVSLASGRRVKIDEIAGLLRRAAPDEIPVAVAFLSGELPRERTARERRARERRARERPARERPARERTARERTARVRAPSR